MIPKKPPKNEQTGETERLGWPGSWSLQSRGDSRKHRFHVELGAFTDHDPPQDIAESLNVMRLPGAVVSALASDVEYTSHQVGAVRGMLRYVYASVGGIQFHC